MHLDAVEVPGFTEIVNLDFAKVTKTNIDDDLTEMISIDFAEGSGCKTSLSPLFCMGAEYDMPFCRKFSAAFLLRKRFGAVTGFTDARVYVNAAPWEWLDMSVNVGASTFGAEMGWMVDIHPRVLSFFIGSDSMVFRVTPQYIPVNHCNVNLCMGLNIPF